MKLQVIGVKRVQGTAKATGQPFDMCTLYAIVPIERVSNGKLEVTGAGFELAEVSLEAEALAAFKTVKFPAVLELHTDSRPRFGKFETVVTGFTPVASPVAKVA